MGAEDLKSCPKWIGSHEKQSISFGTFSFQVLKKKIQTSLSKIGNL